MDSLHLRRSPAAVSTWDAEAYTVDVVVCAGADVRGYDDRGAMIERIVPKDQRGRLPAKPVPLLLNHQRDGNSVGLGQAEDFRLDGDKIVARLKLSKSHPTAKLIADNLSNNIGAFVSMGYMRSPHREYREGDDRVVEFLIDVREVSLVALPADFNATTRSHQQMSDTTQVTEPQDRQAQPANRAAINSSIRSIAELASLDQAWIDGQIDRSASVDEARAAAFAAMEERGQRTRSISGTPHNRETIDNPEFRGRLMGEALSLRLDPAFKPSDAARSYVGLTLPELAREAVRASGQSTAGLSAATLVQRALHSTADFGIALGDTVGRTMRQAYEATPSALMAVARQTTMKDFRERKRIQTSQFDKLEKVNESGEFKRGSFREEQESYRLETFGKVFGITRQALINDDLGVFNDVPRKLGTAAAAFVAQSLVDLLISGSGAGPLMSDNKRLFHADHANLAGSAGAPDEAKLSAARLAMRKQKDASGQLIAVAPKYIVIPSDLETTIEKLLTTVQAAETANVNPFAGKLTPVVEPRLSSAAAWYLVDPSIEGLEYAYLEGEPGPQTETRVGFDVDGVETRVRLDFGCGFIDWRGWYRNAGA